MFFGVYSVNVIEFSTRWINVLLYYIYTHIYTSIFLYTYIHTQIYICMCTSENNRGKMPCVPYVGWSMIANTYCLVSVFWHWHKPHEVRPRCCSLSYFRYLEQCLTYYVCACACVRVWWMSEWSPPTSA